MDAGKLIVTVAASAPLYGSDVAEGLSPYDVTEELRLVKTALLYADEVRLVSPKVALVHAWWLLEEAGSAGMAFSRV